MKTLKTLILIVYCFTLISCNKQNNNGNKNFKNTQIDSLASIMYNCDDDFDRSVNDENLTLNINLNENLDFQPFHLDLINSFAILGKIKKISDGNFKIDFRLKERSGCDKLKITNVKMHKFPNGDPNPCIDNTLNKKTHHIIITIAELQPNEIKNDYTNFNRAINLSKGDNIDIHIKSNISAIESRLIPPRCNYKGHPDLGNGVCRGEFISKN